MLTRKFSLTISLVAILCAIGPPNIVLAVETRTAREMTTSAPPAQARALAVKVIEAYGGAEKLKNLETLMYKAKAHVKEYSMISDAANTFECEIVSKGDKTRTELVVMGQQLITGYNGIISWTKQGDYVAPTDAKTSLRVRQEVEHGLKLLDDLANKNTSISSGTSKLINGRQCSCLIIKASDGLPTNFYIDPDTYLVTRSEYAGIDPEQGLRAVKVTDYSDYRPIFGTSLPFKTIEYNGEKIIAETLLSDVELVSSGDDSIFEMPAETDLARLKKGPIQVPFDFRANEIIVKARVNDTTDAYFIVDTGATMTVIRDSDATKFGATQESANLMTTGFGSMKTGFIKLKSIAFGDFVLENITVVITDLRGFSDFPGNKPVGVIGADILRRFLVTIDYENGLLTFADPHTVKVPPGAMVIETQPALGVAGLVVEGKLDGKPLTFLVDTGAAFNNASEPLVKSIIKGALLPVGNVRGLEGKKIATASVMFKNVKIGPLTVSRPVFAVAPQLEAGAQGGIIANGSLAILGNPFWSQFRLTVDYRNQRLIIERPKSPEQIEDAKDEIEKVHLKYWRTHDGKAAAAQLRELSRRYEQKSWLASAALCLARTAYIQAEQLNKTENSKSENTAMAQIMADCHKAETLATSSKNKGVLAEVLSTNALLQLKFTKPGSLQECRSLLARADGLAPMNNTLTLACYWLNREKKAAPLILDKLLMIDPSNWDALWEKYKNAEKEGNKTEMALVAHQLKRYYSGIAEVDALRTASGG